jgi:hypothetical protein
MMVALARRGVITASVVPQMRLPGTSVVRVAATPHEAWLTDLLAAGGCDRRQRPPHGR